MSLRVRLTLWYVAVVLLGLGLFAGGVLWQTNRAADAALNQTLARRARDVVGDLRLGRQIVLRPDAPDEGSPQPGEPTLWIRVLDRQGRVAVRQGPTLVGVPATLLAETQAGIHDGHADNGSPVRMLVLPVDSGGRRAATVQVLTTMAALDAARDQLAAAMGLAGGVIVIVATLGGLVLADQALRPVDRLTRLAAEIGAGDLHRRVGEVMGREVMGGRRRRRNDELDRLAETFDGMLARLEEAAAARRRLTADVAHELGTPIATIGSAAEIALRHPRDAPQYRAVLQQVVDESRHMGRLVDDLLLLARADAGRLPMEREIVEVDEVCRQAVRAYEELARERDIALRAILPREALLAAGDEGRLGQVVRNLLDNALRYTPAGGTVTVSLAATRGRDGTPDQVVIRVQDSGPGVSPQERERVFERFHRAETTRPDRGQRAGSGLGLAICKVIVEAHGGRICVTDGAAAPAGRPSRGATFVVTLPHLGGDAR